MTGNLQYWGQEIEHQERVLLLIRGTILGWSRVSSMAEVWSKCTAASWVVTDTLGRDAAQKLNRLQSKLDRTLLIISSLLSLSHPLATCSDVLVPDRPGPGTIPSYPALRPFLIRKLSNLSHASNRPFLCKKSQKSSAGRALVPEYLAYLDSSITAMPSVPMRMLTTLSMSPVHWHDQHHNLGCRVSRQW